MAAPRDPIEPAKTFVSMLAAFVAVLTALAMLNLALGQNSMFGLGDQHVCADVQSGRISVEEYPLTPMFPADIAGGVQVGAGALTLCTSAANGTQQALNVLTQLPDFLLMVATFLLALGLFRLISREGLFTVRAVSRMRLVGWVLILGNLVVSLVTAFSASGLARSMVVRERGSLSWLEYWEPSLTAVVLGTVLVSVARILRVSTAMRKDLEGTV